MAAMGMHATLLAVGPFSRDLVSHMEYPASYYADTREGVLVQRSLFFCGGNAASLELATICGVTDPWDFNQHQVDASKVDVTKLKAHQEEQFPNHSGRDVDAFVALREHGFTFLFTPNG